MARLLEPYLRLATGCESRLQKRRVRSCCGDARLDHRLTNNTAGRARQANLRQRPVLDSAVAVYCRRSGNQSTKLINWAVANLFGLLGHASVSTLALLPGSLALVLARLGYWRVAFAPSRLKNVLPGGRAMKRRSVAAAAIQRRWLRLARNGRWSSGCLIVDRAGTVARPADANRLAGAQL